MSFHSGRAGFNRYRVRGNAPGLAEPSLVEKLDEFKFQERMVTSPRDIEVGWVAGDHLYDMQFSYEKNCYEDFLLMSMRVDTHPVPGELRRAWKALGEQSVRQQAANAEDGAAARLTRSQKAEASDMADRQMREELATGRFRRTKVVPVLWDLRRDWVLINHTGITMGEHLKTLFTQTFGMELELLTAGTRAGELLQARSSGRSHEDARPAVYAEPPAEVERDREYGGGQTPPVPWSVPIENKDFLGNEWLLWLWYTAQQAEGLVTVELEGKRRLELGLALWKQLELECAWGVGGRLSVQCDSAAMQREPMVGLGRAKLPRKAGIMMADVEDERIRFELAIHADRMAFNGVNLPPAADAASEREQLQARLDSLRDLCERMDGLLDAFLQVRFSPAWEGTRSRIRNWISSHGQSAGRRGQELEGIKTDTSQPPVDAPTEQPETDKRSLKLAN
ncbi:MAG: hypothetical protein JJU36_05660 [Phycisphaeraceae bacterium]|nr:hypothetical protein [Phycisphaeraceae bacterium]